MFKFPKRLAQTNTPHKMAKSVLSTEFTAEYYLNGIQKHCLS